MFIVSRCGSPTVRKGKARTSTSICVFDSSTPAAETQVRFDYGALVSDNSVEGQIDHYAGKEKAMFDTIAPNKQTTRVLVLFVTIGFMLSGLPSPLSGRTSVAGNAGVTRFSKVGAVSSPSAGVGAATVQAPSPSYDVTIQDDASGDMLRFNKTTGAYKFSRCGDAYALTGIGTAAIHGCTVTLNHNPSDRRVLATADTCTKRASASVQVFALAATYSLSDRDITNNVGSTDLTPPQVIVNAPNGGEIVDTGSSFTISWTATDDVGVANADVLLSTNGGSTFSVIASRLASPISKFAWTAPVILNNQSVKVRVVARDVACNATADNSDANFTIWNPPASFTHAAEAPIYTTSGGFDAYIYFCNSGMNSIIAEFDFHQPSGDATPNAPAQIALSEGDARKLRVADYLTLGSSAGSVEGSIRLRHNGSSDSDVQAMLVVSKFGEEQSFSTPFVYAASSQAPDSTMQCSPMYYLDDLMTASLAVQNCRNYPVDVDVKLIYGTGDPATPNGTYYLPTITLGGQGRLSTNLAAFKDQLQGAKWGSIVVSAPTQSVAAHTVMRSAVNGVAFSSSFVDPRMSTNTTKVASALKLDYDSATKPCIMVCNTSSTDTRTVTADFQTDSGVPIPSRQVTLAPGQQKMIVLDPVQLLSAHQSAMADVRLNYSGNASDIVAGGVSMSSAEDYAGGSRFVEPRASDGKQLMSPFFRMDARTRGFVQISNLGSSSIRAGVSLKFANSTEPPVTTNMVSVAARRTLMLDIQRYIEQAPGGLTAEGCIELIHNGAPGTVTCSFIAMSTDPIETPLEGGGPPMCHMTVFPNEFDTQPGETTPIYVFTCGGTGAVVWSATAGTITPEPSSDPDVFAASYTVPDDSSEPDTATIQADSANGSGTSSVEIQKVKLKRIDTSNAQGDTGGRLNPDGGTRFVITGKKEFPTVPLRVIFRQGDLSVPIDIGLDSASRPDPKQLAGTAPANTLFVGDAAMYVYADNGQTKISKKTLCDDTGCSAYYSFDPPSLPTSVSVPGFNRSGGNLTITAAGGGFRFFQSSVNPNVRINPAVGIGPMDFVVNTVTPGIPSTINGNVLRAGPDISSCAVEGQSPCKKVSVKNPGGRSDDKRKSAVPLYSLLPGPPPIPQSRFPDNGVSIGGTAILITGDNLDFVGTTAVGPSVTVGGSPAPVVSQTRTSIIIATPPHRAGAGNAITLFDIDNAAPSGTAVPGGAFTYNLTPVKEIPFSGVFIVGPDEGIGFDSGSVTWDSTLNCLSINLVVTVTSATPPAGLGNVVAARAQGSYTYCGCTSPGTKQGDIRFRLVNLAAMNDNRYKATVVRRKSVTPYGGIGSCNGSF